MYHLFSINEYSHKQFDKHIWLWDERRKLEQGAFFLFEYSLRYVVLVTVNSIFQRSNLSSIYVKRTWYLYYDGMCEQVFYINFTFCF